MYTTVTNCFSFETKIINCNQTLYFIVISRFEYIFKVIRLVRYKSPLALNSQSCVIFRLLFLESLKEIKKKKTFVC